MKRLNAPLIFTFASILLLFQSCGDKSIKPEDQEDISYLKNKLKREIFSRAGDVTADYTYTNYNNVMQLEKVLFNEGGEVKKSTTYEVPSTTNKTFFSYEYLHDAPGGSMYSRKNEFYYTGQLMTNFRTTAIYPSSKFPIETYAFTYDAKGFLKSCRYELSVASIVESHSEIEYTTDSKGNVLKAVSQLYNKGVFQSTSTITYEYDDKVNVKLGIGSPGQPAEFFCANNWVKHVLSTSTGENQTMTKQFEYNNLNFPVKCVVKTNGANEQTWEYEYHE